MSNIKDIYSDRENALTKSIIQSVIESIANLEKDPMPDFDQIYHDINELDISDVNKRLLETFCTRSYSTVTGKTFKEVLAYVLQRIRDPTISPYCMFDTSSASFVSKHMLEVLEECIQACVRSDIVFRCIGSCISRIVSALDGFFSDVRITISDDQRITAIFLKEWNKRSGVDQGSAEHIGVIARALMEAGYNFDQFEPWIATIKELYCDGL